MERAGPDFRDGGPDHRLGESSTERGAHSMALISIIVSWIIIGFGIATGYQIVNVFGWHPVPAHITGQIIWWTITVALLLWVTREGRERPC